MRKRSRFQADDASEEPLINLTPLIDVVFVVLITFMLIAPVLDIDSIDLALSGASPERKEFKTGPIAITVRSDNTIWAQGSKMSLAELETYLRQAKKKDPRAIPQLTSDSKSSFGTYQTIKNMLEAIGFEQMDVILKPG